MKAERVRIGDTGRVIVTIGSDPEYGLVDDSLGGQVFVRTLPWASFEQDEGSCGVDGHSDIGEVRANYAVHVKDHIKNIEALIRSWHKRYLESSIPLPRLRMLAGNWIPETDDPTPGDAIGGHIHLGIKGEKMSSDWQIALGAALSYYVAPVLLLLEEPRNAKLRRMESCYGQLGDTRSQPWGLEYRSLGSWIGSKGQAFAVLSYTYLIADAVLNGALNPIKPPPRLATAFSSYKRPALIKHFLQVRRIWRSLPLARDPSIASGLGYLVHCIQRGYVSRDDQDIRVGWGIVKNPPYDRRISPDICKMYIKTCDFRVRPVPLRWPRVGAVGHTYFATIFEDGEKAIAIPDTSYAVIVTAAENQVVRAGADVLVSGTSKIPADTISVLRDACPGVVVRSYGSVFDYGYPSARAVISFDLDFLRELIQRFVLNDDAALLRNLFARMVGGKVVSVDYWNDVLNHMSVPSSPRFAEAWVWVNSGGVRDNFTSDYVWHRVQVDIQRQIRRG